MTGGIDAVVRIKRRNRAFRCIVVVVAAVAASGTWVATVITTGTPSASRVRHHERR